MANWLEIRNNMGELVHVYRYWKHCGLKQKQLNGSSFYLESKEHLNTSKTFEKDDNTALYAYKWID